MTTQPILLVEDNPSDVALTRRAFARQHIANELIVVEDGQQALDLLFAEGVHAGRDTSRQPAVILLDLHLPKLGGIEVLRAIRADPRTRMVPVVVLTTSDESDDLKTCYSNGANSYIRKPIEFEQFVQAVGQLGMYWLLMNEPPPAPSSH